MSLQRTIQVQGMYLYEAEGFTQKQKQMLIAALRIVTKGLEELYVALIKSYCDIWPGL